MALKRTPIPIEVRTDDATREIVLAWQDGRETRHAAYALRCQCPCANCVDELTGERILDVGSVARDVTASAVARVGRYAIQVQWSDGHSTGIYTYEKLRSGELG